MTILDEFTALPLSKQRKWQLRKLRDGLCPVCAKPNVPGMTLCKRHHAVQLKRIRRIFGCVKHSKNTKYRRYLAYEKRKKSRQR